MHLFYLKKKKELLISEWILSYVCIIMHKNKKKQNNNKKNVGKIGGVTMNYLIFSTNKKKLTIYNDKLL